MLTIACDTLPKAGFLEPKCAFGISMLYIVRPNTFIGEGVDFGVSTFPVIKGHSGQTIIPDKIATRIQKVLKAKTGAGSATLTTAYAEALAMAHAMNGKKNCDNSGLEEDGFAPAVLTGGGPRRFCLANATVITWIVFGKKTINIPQ
ncbi:mitochondrial malate dehydrogenase [Culex quinquefasciatus]|uniref:Mitochondrial malate dehydrogenase n=1 Tax=Culex quinquefasciatus TaxID=7176 RepID=B0XF93_CULQU|nr:mitochondrial malate dehydrogenase [Culex quinquefasciatus]|eukprot:XP_001868315.1 mitochondrial malate dehydrogenase [Culex quinquefasciatus]